MKKTSEKLENSAWMSWKVYTEISGQKKLPLLEEER